MKNRIDGAVGVEIILQNGVSSYLLPCSELLSGMRILSVSFCNSNDVPKTPSGNQTLLIGVENLTLKLTDAATKESLHYQVSEIERDSEQLKFNQIIDFELSELIVTNTEYAEYYHERSVYLIFWYGTNTDFVLPENTEIFPLEMKINENKNYSKQDKYLINKEIIQIMLSFPGFTPSGAETLDRAFISNKFITLVGKNEILFSQIPLDFFHLSHSKNTFFLNFLSVDFDKSFIESITTETEELKNLFFNVVVKG